MPKKSLEFASDLDKINSFFQKKIDIFTLCIDNKKKRVLHSDIKATWWNVFFRAASLRRCGSFLIAQELLTVYLRIIQTY